MTITIVRAAPYLVVQDLGRSGFRDVGVPPGGAMDAFAISAANILVGNNADAAALEWSLGGGTMRFDSECTLALAGAAADAKLDGEPVAALTTTIARAGSTLEVGGFSSGRFLYVAISGGIEVEKLLGSRATYLPAHFGGFDGRLIRTGDVLPIGSRATNRPGLGFTAPADLGVDYTRRTIRVVPGPQWSLFSEADRSNFFSQQYSVAHTSDRTGYRLTGTPLSAEMGSLPSEAGCTGTIQLPPEGLPIVLMADSPTVGGYPKIGVVSSSDLPILAQLRTGENFQFEETTVADAQRRKRRLAASLFTLASLVEKR